MSKLVVVIDDDFLYATHYQTSHISNESYLDNYVTAHDIEDIWDGNWN